MDKRKHILVVEDDIGTAEMLRVLLDMEGYAVSSATSGSDATNRLVALDHTMSRHQSMTPDLILLDLQLPDMSGEVVVSQLQHALQVIQPL